MNLGLRIGISMKKNKQPPTVEEQIKFFEKIMNDEDESLCCIVLAALTSPDELIGNKKNQESALSISKFILDNLDKMNISEERKTFVKKYFQEVSEIVAQFQ